MEVPHPSSFYPSYPFVLPCFFFLIPTRACIIITRVSEITIYIYIYKTRIYRPYMYVCIGGGGGTHKRFQLNVHRRFWNNVKKLLMQTKRKKICALFHTDTYTTRNITETRPVRARTTTRIVNDVVVL